MKHSPQIPRRRIGRTDLHVSELGFGGAVVGNLYSEIDDQAASDAICGAFDGGIRFFDTAPFYGYGLSERRIGTALRRAERDSFLLSTKIGRLLHPVPKERFEPGLFPGSLPFEVEFDYSYDGTMRSFEDSLQRLGTERIDMLLIHDVERGAHGSQDETDRRFDQVMNGGYRALTDLKKDGRIGAIGCGLNDIEASERFARAGAFDCFLLAGRYTLLEQNALDTFLPLCVEQGASVIIGGPYNTGILATGPIDGAFYNYAPAEAALLDRVARIEAVCRRHGVPLASAALAFPLRHPAVAAVVPGCRTRAEVEQNLGTYWHPIPGDLWSELRTEGLIRPDAPTAAPE